MYFRSTLASAFTEPSFTCYKLLSRIQEPFLFVKRHAGIQHHVAARRSELAYRSGQGRRLLACEVQPVKRSQLHYIHECLWEFANGNSRVAISAGKLVSWLPLMYNTVSEVSCPISAGTLVS